MKPLTEQSEANQRTPSDSCASTPEGQFMKERGQPCPRDPSWRVTETRGQGSPRSFREVHELAQSTPAVDILILSDGTILVHNLTPAMAAMLNAVNPQDPTIRPRVLATTS